MAREKKVVDASVVVKWFLDEEGSKEALQLRSEHISGKISLVVPDLLFLEVLNALRYKGGTQKTLAEANRALWDIQFHIEKNSSFLMEKAAVLALEYNLSLYDALYLALALLYGCPLVTVDSALAKAANVLVLK
mgnify:CR=1 FL=1